MGEATTGPAFEEAANLTVENDRKGGDDGKVVEYPEHAHARVRYASDDGVNLRVRELGA